MNKDFLTLLEQFEKTTAQLEELNAMAKDLLKLMQETNRVQTENSTNIHSILSSFKE